MEENNEIFSYTLPAKQQQKIWDILEKYIESTQKKARRIGCTVRIGHY